MLSFSKYPSLSAYFSPIYQGVFDMKIIHQRIQTTSSHASHCYHCHHCNVDFVLFHNVTCCANSLLSCIHVNTTYLLNIMCTLVATCVILGRLECTNYHKGHSPYKLRWSWWWVTATINHNNDCFHSHLSFAKPCSCGWWWSQSSKSKCINGLGLALERKLN